MVWIYLINTIYKGCLNGIYGFLNLIKQYPRIKNKWGNKCQLKGSPRRRSFSIRKVNENQQVVLMIINKQLLLRMSHQSQANLKSRTQSATIPIFARHSRLYIYKKWKCVESLTIPGRGVAFLKRWLYIGYITFTHAYWTHTTTVKPRGAEIYTDTHSEV